MPASPYRALAFVASLLALAACAPSESPATTTPALQPPVAATFAFDYPGIGTQPVGFSATLDAGGKGCVGMLDEKADAYAGDRWTLAFVAGVTSACFGKSLITSDAAIQQEPDGKWIQMRSADGSRFQAKGMGDGKLVRAVFVRPAPGW